MHRNSDPIARGVGDRRCPVEDRLRNDVLVLEVGEDAVHSVYLERHYRAAGAVRIEYQLQGRATGELPFGEIGQVTVGRSAENVVYQVALASTSTTETTAFTRLGFMDGHSP
jgi:hypothetical protein